MQPEELIPKTNGLTRQMFFKPNQHWNTYADESGLLELYAPMT